jgi:glycosyltransferase involved in cell wall biosynthesis
MTKPRLLYFALSTRPGPTSRYRIFQYLQNLTDAGLRVLVAPALGDSYFFADSQRAPLRKLRKVLAAMIACVRRLTQLPRIFFADIIVIEREFLPRLPPIFEALIRCFTRGYILELDDAMYLAPGRKWFYPWTMRMARRVIVGNQVLADHVRAYNNDVTVIPTSVDLDRYPQKNSYALHCPARVGWVGLVSNYPHLYAIAPALKSIHEKLDATIVVVSARPPVLNFPIEFIRWDEESEPKKIADFDIGLMPLLDTPFARGKCGLKLLQYMAAGVPVMASPVGVNAAIIKHGENGMLTTSVAAWSEHLDDLLHDVHLRERLGRAGRLTVEQRFSLAVISRTLGDFYLTDAALRR